MSIGDRLKQWRRKICGWFGSSTSGPTVDLPVTPPVQSGGEIRAHFLKGWNGGRCSLFWLSHKTTDAEFAEELAAHKAAGYNTAFVYLFNDKDGDGKHPVNVIEYMDLADKRLAAISKAGLEIWAIVVADDSAAITNAGPNALLAMFDKAAPLHHYFAGVVDGIELLESWRSAAKINTLGQGLHDRGFRVGHHTMPIRSASDYGNCTSSWCDYAMIQAGSPFTRMSEAACRKILADADNAIAATIVAFEQYVGLDGAKLGAAGGYACGGSAQ